MPEDGCHEASSLIRAGAGPGLAETGWTLVSASAAERPDAFRYVFRRVAVQGSPIEVVVSPVEAGRPSYRTTARFGVRYGKSGTDDAEATRRLMDWFVARVLENEPGVSVPEPGSATPEPVPASVPGIPAGACLYLVPGHLGNTHDVSIRGRAVLSQVSHILVEHGMVDFARDILAGLGLDASSKTFLEVPIEPDADADVRRAFADLAARGEPACLFGVTEGTPAFFDPGSGLIAEATRLRVPVRSIGGSSSLGIALMRLEIDPHSFLFLGRIEFAADIPAFAARAAALPDVTYVLFGDGRGCRELLPDLLDRIPWQAGWILADLTTDREAALPIVPPFRGHGPALPDDARVVIVLVHEPDAPRHGRTLAR